MSTRMLLLLLALLLPPWAGAAHAQDLLDWPEGCFSPLRDTPAVEGEGMPRGALIERVDSLSEELEDAQGEAVPRLCYRIAEAYLATGLIKHRRTALDYLRRALEEDPGFFEAARLQAATAHAMRYPGQAQAWYERLCARFPDRPESWYLLGGFHFTEGRRVLDEERFRAAASAFSRAVAADSSHVAARMGLASSLAALGWYTDVPGVLTPIVEDANHGREARFLRACAYTALGREEEAWQDFHKASEGADEALRAVLVYGEGFLEESEILEKMAARLEPALLAAAMRQEEEGWMPEDGVDVELALRDSTVLREAGERFWRSRNPNPTRLTNRSRLEFWQRVIEAEMLFGRPREGIWGWNVAPGAAWVRYGRPNAASYMPPSGSSREGDLTPFRLDYGIVLPDASVPIWVWAYHIGSYQFALIFEDLVMNGNWVAHNSTARRMRYTEKQVPVVFDEKWDEEPSFRMEVSVAAFHRPQGATTLETYLGIETLPSRRLDRPPPEFADEEGDYVLEWAIFDDRDRRVEYRRYAVGDEQHSSRLRRLLGRPPRADGVDPYLMVLPADLRPGQYRLALDLTSLLDGYHESRELALEIRERRIQSLDISDLQLATIFEPHEGYADLPVGMLKHAFAVVPAPGGVFPYDARRLYVYYEIYNLCRDEQGATHFDVSYEVYRRKDKDLQHPVRRHEVVGLDPVDPLGLTYLEESTGSSPQQHVVKGGVIDLEGLEPGNYVLAVTITDRHCGLSAESYAAFAKSRRPKETGPDPGAPAN